MKKNGTFKKVALLGLASGLLLSAQSANASVLDDAAQQSSLMLAGKCGAGKCGGGQNKNPRPKRANELAENDDPNAASKIQDNNFYNNNNNNNSNPNTNPYNPNQPSTNPNSQNWNNSR